MKPNYNKFYYKPLMDGLEVKGSDIEGLGLFATKKILSLTVEKSEAPVTNLSSPTASVALMQLEPARAKLKSDADGFILTSPWAVLTVKPSETKVPVTSTPVDENVATLVGVLPTLISNSADDVPYPPDTVAYFVLAA